MKHLAFIAIASLLFVSCGNSTSETATTTDSTSVAVDTTLSPVDSTVNVAADSAK